ncbi:hypothetical protein BKA70DRAFT_1453572 [Coprinopsis sp. MPI-PUGE-AT-0042]|nr:hypothetical protein BKA70DRAFT_1453572 [Coprinopsis sp. MPI-PUGE-AT-0042]
MTVEKESRLTIRQKKFCSILPPKAIHPTAVYISHPAKCGPENTALLSEEDRSTPLKPDPSFAYAYESEPTHARKPWDVPPGQTLANSQHLCQPTTQLNLLHVATPFNTPIASTALDRPQNLNALKRSLRTALLLSAYSQTPCRMAERRYYWTILGFWESE